jgi:hypothetical protein
MTPRPRLLSLAAALTLAGCAGLQGPDPSNVAAYCTADNALRLGSQARAYFGGCPKDSEGPFLAGLQRGRALVASTPQVWPYLEQMTELEKQLAAAGSEAERERFRTRLREAEWWAIHILYSPGTFSVDT